MDKYSLHLLCPEIKLLILLVKLSKLIMIKMFLYNNNNYHNKYKKQMYKISIWILSNKMILMKVIYKKDKNK